MLWQDMDLFFAEYISVILVFWQQLETYLFSIFTSPKAHPTHKHVVGILGQEFLAGNKLYATLASETIGLTIV